MSDSKANRQATRKPELLAPGGSLEKCKVAFLYGADAVYVGGKDFSLRAYAKNLSGEELAEASFMAHQMGKRLYVTVNIFARETDIRVLPPYLEYLGEIRVDGLIISDPGVLVLARKWAPDIPIHLSTQMNSTNTLSTFFWASQGVQRINVAREITFPELKSIRESCPVELEVFVHGAMCVAFSGRCFLSAFLSDRSANHGLCSQPCRWSYSLVEEKRPGQFFPLHEDPRGSYIFNSKDLCLLEDLDKLLSLGIHAFKIEGRMKGALYLASAVRAYRQAIDRYWNSPETFDVDKSWVSDLNCVSHRPYTGGFLFSDAIRAAEQTDPGISYIQTHTLAGIVRTTCLSMGEDAIRHLPSGEGWIVVQVRSRLVSGMVLEFLSPDGSTEIYYLGAFQDLGGNPLAVAHPNTWVCFRVPFPTFPLQVIRTPVTSRQP